MRSVEEYLDLNYRFSLRKDEDGGFVAEVEELPGCVADGETPNEAVENLREAMKSWIASRQEAGLDIPEPRDTAEYSGKVLLRMPKSLHRKLSEQAAREGVSLNQHMVSTLSEAFGQSQVPGWQNMALGTTGYFGATQGISNWALPSRERTVLAAYCGPRYEWNGAYVAMPIWGTSFAMPMVATSRQNFPAWLRTEPQNAPAPVIGGERAA
jgi:antitoxin HicB